MLREKASRRSTQSTYSTGIVTNPHFRNSQSNVDAVYSDRNTGTSSKDTNSSESELFFEDEEKSSEPGTASRMRILRLLLLCVRVCRLPCTKCS